MTTEVRWRRGTTAQHASFTGANGEVTVDSTAKTLVVHDGTTPGGSRIVNEAMLAAALDDLPASGGTSISPISFGAVGDGVADDTAALQAALNAASGQVVDLLGKTYKVTASLALPSNTTLVNGTLNGSTMANGDVMLEALGTMGTAVSMSAISIGANTFTVSSATGITAKTWLYLESNTIFGFGATKNGELIKVREVSGTTVTPYRRVYDQYATTPQFYRPTLVRNITLRGLRLIGGGNGLNHFACHFFLAENVTVSDCFSTNFGQRHFQFQRCANVRASNCHTEHSDDSTGLSYGFVVANGCDNVTIAQCTGLDLRHGVTIGAENGVDRHVTVTGCTFNGCTDSPIDTHPQAQFVTITGNVCNAGSTLNTQDGLVVQGTDCVVSGNVVTGFNRAGILLQPLCKNSNFGDTTTCVGNIVTGATGTIQSFGIYYNNQRTGGAARVTIAANTVQSLATQGYGVYIDVHADGSTVSGLTVTGNNIYARLTGLHITTATGKFLRCFVISGNVIETLATATYDCIRISPDTANYIERGMISGNSLYGGNYGINAGTAGRVVAHSNMIQIFAAGATSGVTAMSGENYTT